MKTFEYFCPRSIEELVEILYRHGSEARILAGGTDLLVAMKQRKLQPKFIISLKVIPNLSFLQEQENGELRIGTTTLLAEIEESSFIRKRYPMLAKAAACIGSRQVRWRATCGGNLCNGAPSADLAPPLVCLGAKAVVLGKSKRIVDLESFFLGPGQVSLNRGEFLHEVVIPPPTRKTFGTYVKFTRSAMDIAVAGVAALVSFDEGGKCNLLRICLGAVAPVPLRAHAAEKIGLGNMWNEEMIKKIAETASAEAKPIDDVRGTIYLRKTLVEVLTERSLLECLEQAGNTL